MGHRFSLQGFSDTNPFSQKELRPESVRREDHLRSSPDRVRAIAGYTRPVRVPISAILIALVASFACLSSSLESRGLRQPARATEPHFHAHSHAGHTHVHAHRHHECVRVESERTEPDSASSVPCEDDHHGCCGLCCEHAPEHFAIQFPDRSRDHESLSLLAVVSERSALRRLPSANLRRVIPPPRDGPPDHVRHLRTVVLLT